MVRVRPRLYHDKGVNGVLGDSLLGDQHYGNRTMGVFGETINQCLMCWCFTWGKLKNIYLKIIGHRTGFSYIIIGSSRLTPYIYIAIKRAENVKVFIIYLGNNQHTGVLV